MGRGQCHRDTRASQGRLIPDLVVREPVQRGTQSVAANAVVLALDQSGVYVEYATAEHGKPATITLPIGAEVTIDIDALDR